MIGSVVFQNEMITQRSKLVTALGPQTAAAFGGGSAGANVRLIQSLPASEKAVARQAFSYSLSKMWIMYVCFAGCGLIVSFLLTRNVLDKQHDETRTGLEEEKKRRLEREAEKAEKRRSKRASKGELPADVEAGNGEKKDDIQV